MPPDGVADGEEGDGDEDGACQEGVEQDADGGDPSSVYAESAEDALPGVGFLGFLADAGGEEDAVVDARAMRKMKMRARAEDLLRSRV